jgi:hypothetical protein
MVMSLAEEEVELAGATRVDRSLLSRYSKVTAAWLSNCLINIRPLSFALDLLFHDDQDGISHRSKFESCTNTWRVVTDLEQNLTVKEL